MARLLLFWVLSLALRAASGVLATVAMPSVANTTHALALLIAAIRLACELA